MARIRSIKPEIARHETLFDLERELGINVRFAWAVFPTICDREGRFKWRPRDLKLDVLPYDDCDFSRVLDAWLTRGMVVKYRVGHEWYGAVPTFLKHQVPNNRESLSTLPALSDADEVWKPDVPCTKVALSRREARVADASSTRHDPAPGEGEGKGRELEGEGKGNGADADASPPAAPAVLAPDPVDLVFDHWRVVMGHPQAKLDDKRRKAIKGALKLDYTVADLQRAVDGCKASPFHQGQNDRATVYDDLCLILRSADHIDKFVRLAGQASLTGMSPAARQTVSAAQSWLNQATEEETADAAH